MAGTAADDKVRVLIVEDEDLYRDLLRVALEEDAGIEVVGAFAGGEAAVAAAPRLRPQVAMLDIELPGGMNGVQVGLELRRQLPGLGVVLLSNHRAPGLLMSLPEEEAGGWSYLLKRSVSDVETLRRALAGAASGLVVLDPRLVTGAGARPEGRLAGLTSRHREILGLIAQGFTNAAIAQRLHLSPKTVENQINALYQELGLDRGDPGVQPRVKAVLIYLQESRLSPDPFPIIPPSRAGR